MTKYVFNFYNCLNGFGIYFHFGVYCVKYCRNPTLAKCGVKPNTSKVGDLESSGTPECLELDNKAQNTSR